MCLKYRSDIEMSGIAEVVEFGRHAVLRGRWRKPCRFKSGLRHQSVQMVCRQKGNACERSQLIC